VPGLPCPDREAYDSRVVEAPKQYHWVACNEDLRLVMEAAGLLHIREFDLFRLAWRRWSGNAPNEKALERYFVAYMFRQTLPPWVRHFCREVLAQEAAGHLDPTAFGVQCAARREAPESIGHLFLGVTLAVLLLIYPVMAEMVGNSRTSASLACGAGPGMQVFVELAHALAGRPAPACPPSGRKPGTD
jgi:hypothetical protein